MPIKFFEDNPGEENLNDALMYQLFKCSDDVLALTILDQVQPNTSIQENLEANGRLLLRRSNHFAQFLLHCDLPLTISCRAILIAIYQFHQVGFACPVLGLPDSRGALCWSKEPWTYAVVRNAPNLAQNLSNLVHS
jgi:hypothetical protein